VPPEYLHPEFGWFAPSTSARRKARLAFASVALFAVVGTIILRAGREPQIDAASEAVPVAALVAARAEETPPRLDIAPAVAPVATTDGLRSPETFRTACASDPWSYIDGTCKAEKPHRHKNVRAATNAANANLSRVALGHSSRPVVASSEAHAGAAGTNQSGEAVALDMSIPPAPRAPEHTKVHKASPSRNASRDLPAKPSWRDDSWNAQAFAFPRNRNQWSWGWSWSPPQTAQPPKRR
jgi:hypothetical protein